jgi:hypothetical protein
MPNDKPFPFWLFSASPPEYARGLLRFDLLEEVPRRLGYVLGNKAERARADGYWDYEPEYIRQGFETDLGLRERLERRPGDQAANPTGQFPVAEALRKAISSLPQEVALVLVFPPVYQALLPRPGTARANSEASCKAAIREAVAEHAKSTVIDWRVDRAENRSAVHFFDQTHYRQPIARALESEIADALKRMR